MTVLREAAKAQGKATFIVPRICRPIIMNGRGICRELFNTNVDTSLP